MDAHARVADSVLPPRLVVIVAGGDVPERAALDAAWPGWADGLVGVLAADSGLAHAHTLGLRPDLLVGDLDSLGPDASAEAQAHGLPVLRSRVDKDESDTELALLEALHLEPERIIVLGAFGGPRLDHALANVWLLGLEALAGQDVVLLDERTRVSLVSAPAPDGGAVTRSLMGRPGCLVTLLPLGGDAIGITTHGLRYPLRDEDLRTGPARGLSNVRELAEAAVTLRAGRLLVVEAAPAVSGLDSAP